MVEETVLNLYVGQQLSLTAPEISPGTEVYWEKYDDKYNGRWSYITSEDATNATFPLTIGRPFGPYVPGVICLYVVLTVHDLKALATSTSSVLKS